MKFASRSSLLILLWFALSTGLTVSIFSVIEEMCLATACSDTASFTLFGVGIGVFGIAYFVLLLILLWLRNKTPLLDWALSAMLFTGVGAEVRLLWIQKYIIGSWCPLCVTICISLFIAAIVLVIEKIAGVGSANCRDKNIVMWLVIAATMVALGMVVAYVGVQALA